MRVILIGYLAVYVEFNVQGIEIRSAHLRRPPQAWVRKTQLRELVGLKRHFPGFVRPKLHLLFEFGFLDPALESAFDRLIARVLQLRCNRELSAVVCRGVHLRDHRGIAYGHRAAGRDINLAPQSHVLVGWRRIPIYESNCQISIGWREDLNGECILRSWLRELGDVEFIGAPCARDLLEVGDLLAIHPDIRAVVDPSEIQPDGLTFFGRWQGE